MYDFVDPQYNYSIFDYQKDARKCINHLMEQNKNIILVGGSSLYIRASLYDFVLYKKDKDIDSEKYDHYSSKELYDKLLKIDFNQSQKIHFNNKHRIIRTLQIFDEYQKTKIDLESLQKYKIIYETFMFMQLIWIEKQYIKKLIKELTLWYLWD